MTDALRIVSLFAAVALLDGVWLRPGGFVASADQAVDTQPMGPPSSVPFRVPGELIEPDPPPSSPRPYDDGLGRLPGEAPAGRFDDVPAYPRGDFEREDDGLAGDRDADRDASRNCHEFCRNDYTDCLTACERESVGDRDDCEIACDEAVADCRLDCREDY